MTDRILVPIDGSPLSWKALTLTLEEYPDAKIVALTVIDPTEPSYSVYGADFEPEVEPLHGSEEWYDRHRELVEELFEEVRDVASDHDVELTTETGIGEPGRVIVDYAEENGVDHVVLGSHGRDEDARILLGGVTESVAFRAPVRVSLIR